MLDSSPVSLATDSPSPQESRRAGQVFPGLAAERQVIERDQQGEPVGDAAGRVQALAEETGRGVVVTLPERDLAEEVVHEGD
jgi:hypothetical protein